MARRRLDLVRAPGRRISSSAVWRSAMVQDCPKCGMVNPPEAQRCDCGYDFASRQMKQSYLGAKDLQSVQSPTPVEWLVCVLIPIIGLILGFRARSRGRRGAGNTMLAVSAILLAFWIGI